MPALWERLIDAGIALLFGDLEGDSPTPAKPKPRTKAAAERTVHRVRQVHDSSCGVAAVAMLARVPHAKAEAFMFPSKPALGDYGTQYADVRKALQHFGVPHGDRAHRVSAWDSIPDIALVKVSWKQGRDSGRHWVIFQRKSPTEYHVIDPNATSPETLRLDPTEIAGYQLMSYLSVSPRPPKGAKPRAARTTSSAPVKKAAKKKPAKKKPAKKRLASSRKLL